jgi:hypothetical protein
MFDPKRGFFYFRVLPLGFKNKIPMLHWSQGVIYKGLALLSLQLKHQEPITMKQEAAH